MTKWIALPAAFVAAATLTLNVEAAQKSTNAKANSPKTTKTTTKSPSAKSPKSTTTTTAKNHGSSKKSGSTTTASTSTNPTTPTTTTTDWKPTNAVAEKLMTKPNQLAKLKAVLPAGTDINLATAGFKNFGQLNAAVNVSQNLGIEFADLKAAMTGTTLEGVKTNEPTKSLGQAIQQFKPGVNAEAEAAAATAQATKDGGQ
jgi:hypothetical protein